jgi:membrane protein DedA with SNARE-associated domain
MEELFIKYGAWFYLVLLLGSFVEGESVVLTAGFFAYKGYLSLPLIILISFSGTLFADQLLFFIGRWYGPGLLERRPKLKETSKRVFELLHKYHTWYILGFRFVYGVRVASPLVIGAAGISVQRFVILNFIAAIIWSVLSCLAGYVLGYFFADQIEIVIQKAIKFQKITIGIIVLIIAGVSLYYYWRRKKKEQQNGDDSKEVD